MDICNFTIDGNDAFKTWGVFIEKDGLAQLIQVPSFKKVETTEWDEYDGIEADLIKPVLDARSVTLTMHMVDVTNANALFNFLKSGNVSYHNFAFTDINREYKLRLTSNGSFSSLVKLGKLTLTFAQDLVTQDEQSYYTTAPSDVWQRGYSLNGVDFSKFGIFVLKGTNDSLRKYPTIRENLKVSLSDEEGTHYDDYEVHYKSKDVTLNLLIDASDISEFWKRFNSLFTVLIKPKYITFEYKEISVKCYYKSMAVSKFRKLRNGKIWCEFTVTLTFTYDTEEDDTTSDTSTSSTTSSTT